MWRRVLLVCGVALAVVSPIGAQVSVTISPMVGYYPTPGSPLLEKANSVGKRVSVREG